MFLLGYTEIQSEIPADIPINPFNHTLDRKDHTGKKLSFIFKKNIHKMKERMCLTEYPFGIVKWYHRGHTTFYAREKKRHQPIRLSFLAYNMKRAINMVGTKKLIEAMQG